jgi:hypothetical protein
MKEFEKEVIDRLARIETKFDTLPCSKHGMLIEKIEKIALTAHTRCYKMKIWAQRGAILALGSSIGFIIYHFV